MKDLAKWLSIAGGALFVWSELAKDPKERVLLSRESKLASLAADVFSL